MQHHRSAHSTPPRELPFWEQLPQVLLYPLHASVLLASSALALFSLLAALPGLVGTIMLGITWLATYGYGFEVLRRAAHGNPAPPEHPGELLDGGVLRLVALMALCLASVVWCGQLFGPWATLALIVVLFVLHPVWLISLALDGSLRQALNPATAVFTLQRIAGPYALAVLLIGVLQFAAALLFALAHRGLPDALAWPLSTFGYAMALFTSFRLLGVMVHSYRHALGFQAQGAPAEERLPSPTERADQLLLARVERLQQEGREETARLLLEQAVRTAAVGEEVHARLHALLADAPLAQRQAHAGQWLLHRLQQGHPGQALALWRSALAEDPGFTPALADTGEQLVHTALARNQRQLAHDGLRALLQRWPQSPRVAEWALQAALLTADLHSDADSARQLIAQGLASAPDTELQRRLHAALATLPPATL